MRGRMPTLDARDRRVVMMAALAALFVTLLLVGGAAIVGLAVRVFILAAGL